MSSDETSPGEKRPAERPKDRSPSWEPYQSPEATSSSVLRLLRRHSFSITLVVAALAVGALIYFSPKRLSPKPDSEKSSPVSRYSTLSVYSDPTGASVIVGADTVGSTPLENHRIRAGTYLVSVAKEDYLDRDTALTLAASQSAVYAPQLNRKEELSNAEQGGTQELSTTESFGAEPSSNRPQEGASNQESYAGGTSGTRQGQGTSEEQEPRSRSSVEGEANSLVTGSLELKSDPEIVMVELNGYRVGSTPMRLGQVAAGTHEVTFTRPGYQTVTKRVQVNGRDTITVKAALKAQTGQLRVLVHPWGSIYINGQRRAEDSDVWYETQLQAGTHTVMARHPALGEKERAVEVAPSDTQSVVLDLREN